MTRYLIASVTTLALAAAWLLPGPTATEDPVEHFLDTHWAHPIAPQGEPPAAFSSLEASLGAEACAQCHAEQYRDWSRSLHSQALGPGIRWQLRLMGQAQANRCLQCHAPLAEQKALLAREHDWPGAPASEPPAYVPADLGHQGVMCSSCHVREHRRFGPPPAGEVRPVAHDGFSVKAAYEDSRFCATCHQFPDDGPRVNGKLQEDTLAQWQASPWAKKQSCQQCHMPERRHAFRGIHDPEMVRRAVSLTLSVEEAASGPEARVSVANVGAGHHFPTYMVPKAYLRLALVGPDGQQRILAEHTIGWQVDTDITREIADTRIPAGETLTVRRRFPRPADGGWRLEATLSVAPREHYERVFAKALRQADRMDKETADLLRTALTEARATRFEALRIHRDLENGTS